MHKTCVMACKHQERDERGRAVPLGIRGGRVRRASGSRGRPIDKESGSANTAFFGTSDLIGMDLTAVRSSRKGAQK